MDIPRRFWKWRSQTWVVIALGFTAILIALITSYALATFRPTVQVKVGSSGIYNLWVADTDASLYQGLSGVSDLPRGGGLLMDFKIEGIHGISMRKMIIPIDAVWVNESKRVVYIVKNIPPELGDKKSFFPKDPARYILELPAGSVSNSAIKVGDKVNFDLSELSI